MNVYEAIRTYLTESMYNTNGYDARVYLAKLIAEYDALAPYWDSAPEWAQWCAIDADGACAWYETEPVAVASFGVWNAAGHEMYVEVGTVDLPDHIDWRDCKWQRPEVTA